MKKKYKIVLTIVVIAVIAVLVVLFWPKEKETETPSLENGGVSLPGESSDNNGEVKTEKFSLIRISDEETEVFDFWENKETGDVYYISTRGDVKIAKVGPDPEISTREISAINSIEPDVEGERVLISFGDPNSPDWGLFDSSDEVWRPLPSYIKSVVWGGEENEVISITNTEDGKSLVSFDIEELRSGENQVEDFLVRDFSLKDVEIAFSPPSSVIVMEKPASFYGSRAWKLDINDKKMVQIVPPIKGLVMNWKENGLVFLYEGERNLFNILDKNLNNFFPIPFTTLPSKCSAGEDVGYCFVPVVPFNDLGNNIKLPEDYFKNKFYTSDSLYKMDFESDELEMVLDINDFKLNIDAFSPQQIGESVYFINKYNKALYQLTINI
jgi:hypothetical protein